MSHDGPVGNGAFVVAKRDRGGGAHVGEVVMRDPLGVRQWVH